MQRCIDRSTHCHLYTMVKIRGRDSSIEIVTYIYHFLGHVFFKKFLLFGSSLIDTLGCACSYKRCTFLRFNLF